MKTWLMVIGILFIIALIAGCVEQKSIETGQELKIGVIASMTGPASSTGKDIWQSAELAADEINAQGGVHLKDLEKNLSIKLILGDDESTREGGQKVVSKLITQDQVTLLVGGFSSAVVSAHQSIVAENKIPYIITGASTPIITHRDDLDTSMIFHFCPTTDDFGEKTTLFADSLIRKAIYERYNLSADRPLRLGLILQDSPFGKGVQSAVNKTITENDLNVDVVAEETFKMGETDFRTILTSVKAAKPDVVYTAAFLNEQIPLITQARRDIGLNTIFIVVECNDDPDYYSGLGKQGEYSIIETRFSPYAVPNTSIADSIRRFGSNFEVKYGSFPGMMGASTYEGVYIAAQAVTDAGTLDKNQIINVLKGISMPQMIETMQGGVISFTDDFREAKFDLYMEQLIWDDKAGELRPKIVWPDHLKETEFVLPDWYVPGP